MGFSFYKHEYPTGKKSHKCEFCGRQIKKGIKYSKEVGKYDGEFFSRSMHIECNNMLIDYCDLSDDFSSYDQVRDYLVESHCVGCQPLVKDGVAMCTKPKPEICPIIWNRYKEIL